MFLAIDLGVSNLIDRQQPFFEQDRNQILFTGREPLKHGFDGRNSASPRSTASDPPADGCDDGNEESTAETSSACNSPKAFPQGELVDRTQ